ncbi:hypothetical protein MKW98_011353 [Papaver atlanticum]|uniref:Uncharacterized protein n=1 Tax=Papaver atlanticum TaxID=357466 RepID=A0AAD4SU01_9MAGN|nr:hypothetical protein MKW98_011353 [Papaver atlanticum]
MYGHLLKKGIVDGTTDSSFENRSSIAVLLVNRAFNKYELEDVRKLAAELCGRLHPKVYPRGLASNVVADCNSSLSNDAIPVGDCHMFSGYSQDKRISVCNLYFPYGKGIVLF